VRVFDLLVSSGWRGKIPRPLAAETEPWNSIPSSKSSEGNVQYEHHHIARIRHKRRIDALTAKDFVSFRSRGMFRDLLVLTAAEAFDTSGHPLVLGGHREVKKVFL